MPSLEALLNHSLSLGDVAIYASDRQGIPAHRYLVELVGSHPEAIALADVMTSEPGIEAIERVLAGHQGVYQLFGNDWHVVSFESQEEPF